MYGHVILRWKYMIHTCKMKIHVHTHTHTHTHTRIYNKTIQIENKYGISQVVEDTAEI